MFSKGKGTDRPALGGIAGYFFVLHLCSVKKFSGAKSENWPILYRQNVMQETLLSIVSNLPSSSQAGRQCTLLSAVFHKYTNVLSELEITLVAWHRVVEVPSDATIKPLSYHPLIFR